MMHMLYAFLLAAVTGPAHAAGDVAPFPAVQEKCVEVGAVTLGKRGRWSHCAVTKARWMATMDFLDQYQVQYCLSMHDGGCEHRAFLVFANRAYTPDARLLIQHIDAGTLEYEDPLIVKTAYGRLLTLTAIDASGERKAVYYVWRGGRWVGLEAKGWTRQLTAQLPVGTRARPEALWPDIDGMTVHAPLYRRDGTDAAQTARVELAVRNDRFVVKRVAVEQRPAPAHAAAMQPFRDGRR